MLDEPVWKLPGQCSDGERLSSLKIEGVARKIDHTIDRVWADASEMASNTSMISCAGTRRSGI